MKLSRTTAILSILLASATMLVGCVGPEGATVGDKRAEAQQMRSDALTTFYAKMPHLRDEIARAPGYGVFSGIGTQTLIVSSGQGFGIIRDNATRRDTYMRVFKLGGGLGVGAEGVRAVVIFHDAQTMYDVLEHGWGVSGKGAASAKVGDTGDAGSVVITLPGMSIYRFTRNGAMLGGAIEGTKVWKDDELN